MNRYLNITSCCVLLLWVGASAATAAETWQLESTSGDAIPAPNAGNEQFTWDGMADDGRHGASGPYFVRAGTADATGIRKLMLVK